MVSVALGGMHPGEVHLVEFQDPSYLLFSRRGHVFLVPSSTRQCAVESPGAVYAEMGVVSVALGGLHPGEVHLVEFEDPSYLLFSRRGRVFLVPSSVLKLLGTFSILWKIKHYL